MSIHIDRCLCYKVGFAHIFEHACQNGTTDLPQLSEELVFGKKCGLCLPYIRRMLETGETVFSRVISDDSQA